MHLISEYLGWLSLGLAVAVALLPQYTIWFVAIIALCIFSSIMVERFISKKISINGGKTNLVLEYGDLFEKRNGIIVIPVDRNYNTIVDERIISKNSLHGVFINTIFCNHLDDLNKQLAQALKTEQDSNGAYKTQCPGCAILVTNCNDSYCLLALSQLDSNYRARCTPEEYATAIECLLNHIDTHFGGKVVYMPLIGSGLSDVFGSMNDTESLQILVSLIKLSQSSRVRELHIIINKKSKHRAKIHKII